MVHWGLCWFNWLWFHIRHAYFFRKIAPNHWGGCLAYWFPELDLLTSCTVGVSGTGGSWSTISSRMSASPSSDNVILGVQAAAPLLTLTVPGTVSKTAFLNTAACCQLMLTISAEAVVILGLISLSSASVSRVFADGLCICSKLSMLFLSYTK